MESWFWKKHIKERLFMVVATDRYNRIKDRVYVEVPEESSFSAMARNACRKAIEDFGLSEKLNLTASEVYA